MFADIALRYDLMNRLMTFGRDKSWRRYAVSQLRLGRVPIRPKSKIEKTKTILDVATGTGDLALEVREQFPDARVVGLDVVPDMLKLAREKAGGSSLWSRAMRWLSPSLTPVLTAS